MIIGLCGYAQAGKDESGRYLTIAHDFQRIAFADKLKELALAIDPLVVTERAEWAQLRLSRAVELWGWDEAKRFPDVRRILQNLGHGARVVVDDAIWIKAVEQEILSSPRVVMTDVRYANEAELILSQGGWLVRVERAGVGPVNAHITETALDGFNVSYTVENNGTVEDLGRALDLMLAHITQAEAMRVFQ